MKLFNKGEVKRLPEPELKRIPIENLKFAPYTLIASANAYVKLDVLRPGRADSACYHIAKLISQCYEEEVNRPQRGRPRKVAV